MLDASRPFMESVRLTLPYLQTRSVGGSLMVLGHLVFVGHFLAMAMRFGPARTSAALFWQQARQPHPAAVHGQ
jgi:cytochrome c oxidase cbb3-type subunit 1